MTVDQAFHLALVTGLEGDNQPPIAPGDRFILPPALFHGLTVDGRQGAPHLVFLAADRFADSAQFGTGGVFHGQVVSNYFADLLGAIVPGQEQLRMLSPALRRAVPLKEFLQFEAKLQDDAQGAKLLG